MKKEDLRDVPLGRMQNLKDMKFGKWDVLSYIGKDKHGKSYWNCKCKCGKEILVSVSDLKTKQSTQCKSCATIQKNITHKLRHHPLYSIWAGMKYRCDNKKNTNYKYYGGRGISVCEEWKNDFKVFYNWCMKNGWARGLTIDRIDNNGNYEHGNCRFVTNQINCQNSRQSKLNIHKVKYIRFLIKVGNTNKNIAKWFSVCEESISRIRRGKSWTNIPDELEVSL